VKRISGLLVFALVVLFPVLRVSAQQDDQPQVQVDVEKHPALNQTIRLTYTFRGTGSVRVPPIIPLKNLAIVGGPATSTQISFVNGDISRTFTITYYLRARAVGPAEVGEVHFAWGDKVAKAPGQPIEVEAARAGGAAASPDAGEPMEEDPFALFRRSRVMPEVRTARRPSIVEYLATPEKTSAYVGEEITVTYDLLTDSDVEGLEYVDPPKFPSCWAEDLEKPEKPIGKREIVDGRPVTRFTLLKKAVAGLAPGTVTLPSAKIRLAVRSAGDPFSDPFSFFQRQVVERESKPIVLKVLPIPGDAKFRGPVGHFDLSAKVDHDRVTAGDALTLKVRLAGAGNLRNAAPEAPKIEIPNARVYPPTTKSDAAKGRPGGSIEWSYVVVPNAKGALTIPSAEISVFDPAEKRILTKKTDPVTVEVEGGAAPAVASKEAGPAKEPAAPASASSGSAETLPAEEVAAAPTPAAPHHAVPGGGAPGPAVDMAHRTVTLPLWALAAIPAALLVLGGSALAMRAQAKKSVDVRAALAPEANETKERAAARIERAVRDWLEKRHGIPDGLSAASVDAALTEKSAPPDLRQGLVTLLSELEFLRFAPQLGDYEAKIAEVRALAARLLPRLK
jgi:hypothetical protein